MNEEQLEEYERQILAIAKEAHAKRESVKKPSEDKLAIVNPDPWKHRSEGMRCKTCMWFAPKQSQAKLGYDLGRCRRHAPTMSGYPVVYVNDWCGDHRVDENKV